MHLCLKLPGCVPALLVFPAVHTSHTHCVVFDTTHWNSLNIMWHGDWIRSPLKNKYSFLYLYIGISSHFFMNVFLFLTLICHGDPIIGWHMYKDWIPSILKFHDIIQTNSKFFPFFPFPYLHREMVFVHIKSSAAVYITSDTLSWQQINTPHHIMTKQYSAHAQCYFFISEYRSEWKIQTNSTEKKENRFNIHPLSKCILHTSILPTLSTVISHYTSLWNKQLSTADAVFFLHLFVITTVLCIVDCMSFSSMFGFCNLNILRFPCNITFLTLIK